MLIKAVLLIQKNPNLSDGQAATLEVAPGYGALDGEEAGVLAGGLKYLTLDFFVFHGNLLVRLDVCVFLLPHLGGYVGLPGIKQAKWRESGGFLWERVIRHHSKAQLFVLGKIKICQLFYISLSGTDVTFRQAIPLRVVCGGGNMLVSLSLALVFKDCPG